MKDKVDIKRVTERIEKRIDAKIAGVVKVRSTG